MTWQEENAIRQKMLAAKPMAPTYGTDGVLKKPTPQATGPLTYQQKLDAQLSSAPTWKDNYKRQGVPLAGANQRDPKLMQNAYVAPGAAPGSVLPTPPHIAEQNKPPVTQQPASLPPAPQMPANASDQHPYQSPPLIGAKTAPPTGGTMQKPSPTSMPAPPPPPPNQVQMPRQQMTLPAPPMMQSQPMRRPPLIMPQTQQPGRRLLHQTRQ